MKLNNDGTVTVWGIQKIEEYNIEKPKWLSKQGWEDFVNLWFYKPHINDFKKILNMLKENIEETGKDSGKDLIHILELAEVELEFNIILIKKLMKSKNLEE